MLNTKLVTWSMTLFTTVSYLVCVAFGLLTPDTVHMHDFLESVLPAFRWISAGSFMLGFVESALWGMYIGLVFCLIYNGVFRRWSAAFDLNKV